ncbi:MAG: alpha-ribazole phosphatase [Catenibacterium mitsuokai]|nr:alpha-ribazole phosphatase [Catenibacterium mitsuokai]MDY3675692.1 alpha-ribazole phosphatase [Catenibacterium mitsuokai]MDY5244645.1 alpha-ribazole phosphatase [Anaerobutyricum soehngenii]
MIMRLYLIRHGETALNAKGCYYGRTDAVLSEKGISQARYLKEILKEVSFDYIVASPLVRAYNTAQIVMEEREQEIFGDRRLMEQDFGIFEGMTYKEIQSNYPKELDAWNEEFSTYRIPKGESFADVRSRTEDFLRDIPSGRESKGEKMLIAAHKGTLGHLLAAMLKLPLDGYWNFVFEQGCYSVVDLEDGYAIIRKLNASISVEGEPASVKSVK